MEKIIFEANKICKKYNKSEKCANKDVDLMIHESQILGLLGPNGAGKTTFVRQASGLLRPDSGTIRLFGENIERNRNIIPNYISYMGQIAYTHRCLTVKEFLIHTGVYRGIKKNDADYQMVYFLKYFDVERLKNRLLGNLSGGEIRIVSFIAALIGLRPLIFLDEPTNDMDPEKRIRLWELVKKMRMDLGISFLLVTHNIHEAEDVVDEVAIMKDGIIIANGSPRELAANLFLPIKVLLTVAYNNDIEKDIFSNYNFKMIDREHLMFFIEKEQLVEFLYYLYHSSAAAKLKDIKIIHPSLEDIYIKKFEG